MSLTSKNKETKLFIKELNKDWSDYTKRVDSMIDIENIRAQKNRRFIIRRRKNCDISLCDIIESEMKKLDKLLDDIK